MAATENIDTIQRQGDVINLPVAAATHIYAGTLAARNATGDAVPASDTAGLRVIGRAETEVDNSAGLAGDARVSIARGVFRYANSDTDAVTAAHIGSDCYAEDDETVASAAGTNSLVAGKVVALEGDSDEWVWVDTVPALYADVSAP